MASRRSFAAALRGIAPVLAARCIQDGARRADQHAGAARIAGIGHRGRHIAALGADARDQQGTPPPTRLRTAASSAGYVAPTTRPHCCWLFHLSGDQAGDVQIQRFAGFRL